MKSLISFNVRGVDSAGNAPVELIRRMGGVRSILLHRYPGQFDDFHKLLSEGLVDIPIWRTHKDDNLMQDHPDAERWVERQYMALKAAGLDQRVALALNIQGLQLIHDAL